MIQINFDKVVNLFLTKPKIILRDLVELGCTGSDAHALLKREVKKKHLIKTGFGRGTYYCITNQGKELYQRWIGR